MRHRWPRVFLAPVSAVLRSGNPRDTIDRLFDSRHLNDLRLIAAAAFTLTFVVFVVAATVAVSSCVAAWSTQAHGTFAELVVFLATQGGEPLVKVFGPTLVLLGTVFAWAYQVGSARLGVVDSFACEIDTLCRVVTVTGLVDQLVQMYSSDVPGSAPPQVGVTSKPDPFSSQENYFPILDGDVRDLQSLEADVVTDITAFYTYMKAVRDTFRKLAETNGVDRRKEVLTNLVYVLYLALESGRKALGYLDEYEPIRTERTMVVLLSELAAYGFLRDRYREPNEFHYQRLILRGPGYLQLMRTLSELLECKRRELLPASGQLDEWNPSYESLEWFAALQLDRPLRECFAALEKRFPLGCVVAKDRIMGGMSSITTRADGTGT
jgi:hypothetical protein